MPTYLLSLDLGTSSIGYVVFGLDENGVPEQVNDLGVRIFPDGRDPKSKEPLAVGRRMARGMRRNRDRGQNRVRRLVKELIDAGLLPEGEASRRDVFNDICPYAARASAVRGPVSAHTLGRAIFHIGRRRGFKSNRLSGDDDETDYKKKIADLRVMLEGKTLGEYLYARIENNHLAQVKGRPGEQKVVRFRNGETEFYADRQMYWDEFQRIREVQGNTLLTDDQWDALQETAFFQYPLKPVPKGKCHFYPDEARAASSLPIAQKFRIYQEVNNLRYTSQGVEHALDERQRLGLYAYLNKNKTVSFSQIVKKLKDEHKSPYFPRDASFNLDVDGRGGKLFGNDTLCELRKEKYLGKLVDQLELSVLNDLVAFLNDPEKLVMNEKTGKQTTVVMETTEVEAEVGKRLPQLAAEQVRALATMRFKRDTMRVSRKFMQQIVPVLEKTGLVYSDAVAELGRQLGTDLHHSSNPLEERDELPYYGEVLVGSVWGDHAEADANKLENERDNDAFEFGKIANPTVHVALNQLRRVVNAVIRRHGKPTRIHLELTRDLKSSKDERSKIQRHIERNRKNNERIRELLQAEYGIAHPHREDLQKLKLWEELGAPAFSIFTGTPIAASQLFNGEVEIEHIIPFSRCYDDGMSNKTLAFKHENNAKGNSTPAEAADRGKFDYEEMLKRALKVFGQSSKYARFKKDAFAKFYGENGELNMIERQLNDTRYISKVARRYLSCLFPKDADSLVAVNGRMTAILRDVWNLNRYKDKESGNYREDHRHHIVDAFVVGMTSRRLVQQTSRRRSVTGESDANLYRFLKARLDDIPELRGQLYDKLEDVVASYKPDHTSQGSMFNDTAYGIREHADDKQVFGLTRKPVANLSFNEVFQICGKSHRQQVLQHLTGGAGAGDSNELSKIVGPPKKLQAALAQYSEKTGHRKLRIRIPNNSIKAISSAPFKGYAKNSYAYCDIWMVPHKKDKKTGKWSHKYQGVFVAYADVKDHKDNPEAFRPLGKSGLSHPAAKKLMRLYKQDNIRLTDKETGETVVMKVAGYNVSQNKLALKDNLSAGDTKPNQKSINSIFPKNHVTKLRM